MFVYVAWFAKDPANRKEDRARWTRARSYLDGVTPATWSEHAWSGKGWGMLLRQAPLDVWRWTFGEQVDGRSTVCAGVALGGGTTTPDALAQRMLRGEDVHRDLAAPFAVLSVDDSTGRMAIQQDWHGMGQVFRYDAEHAVVFSNRPSLAPTVLGHELKPNIRGWSLYLADSAFSDSSSPIRGVRLLDPGERIDGTRDLRGHWKLQSERRFNVDDLVQEARRGRPALDDIGAAIVDKVRRVVRDLAEYWPKPLLMGLSGGKDSRLLAAALLDEDIITGFRTNEDYPREGEIARALVQILREERGLAVTHELHVATPTESVLSHSLWERAQQLQKRHDFMFRAAYLNRPLAEPYPEVFGRPRVLGVFGEYVIDEWVPKDWAKDPGSATYDGARQALERKLIRAVPRKSLRPAPLGRMTGLIDGYVARGREHGLDPFGALHYGYMLGRIRRTCTSLTNPEQIMPMAVPETVLASFQVTPQEKIDWSLHRAVIDRIIPAWSDVPTISTGMPSQDKMRVWHGAGAGELREITARAHGPITSMLKQRWVHAALAKVDSGEAGDREDELLRQFTMAAAAEAALTGRD